MKYSELKPGTMVVLYGNVLVCIEQSRRVKNVKLTFLYVERINDTKVTVRTLSELASRNDDVPFSAKYVLTAA